MYSNPTASASPWNFDALWSSKNIRPAVYLLLATSFFAIVIGYVIAEVLTSNPWGLLYLGENPALRANDLTRLMDAARGFTPQRGVARVLPGEPVPYPPAAFVYLGLLAELSQRAAFFVFYIPCLLYLWVASRIAVAAGPAFTERCLWFAAIALSYPVLYILDRGNLDAYAALGCFAFVYCLAERHPKTAAIFLSIAAALKIYPAILSILLLQRNVKAFWIFAILAVLETGVALWILSQSPVAAMTEFLTQLANSDFCYGSVTLCLNLSAAVPFKVVFGSLVTYNWYPSFSGSAASAYGLFSVALAVFAIAWVLIRRAPLWQQVLLLTCIMNLVPVMSYDYKLALYFMPLFLILDQHPRDQRAGLLVFMIAIMLSSFKWLSGPVHLWIHALTQILLFVMAVSITPHETLASDRSPRVPIKRFSLAMSGIGAVLLGLLIWNVAGPGLVRSAWATSRAWCPSSFAFSKKDPSSLWGSGWGSFDGPQGEHWRWTTATNATIYLPVNSGRVGFTGVTALPPGLEGGSVQIYAAGLLKANIPITKGQPKPFSFDVSTVPAASDNNTIPIEFRIRDLVAVGDKQLGAVVSGLRMTASCPAS